jgi:hypothetical protein
VTDGQACVEELTYRRLLVNDVLGLRDRLRRRVRVPALRREQSGERL